MVSNLCTWYNGTFNVVNSPQLTTPCLNKKKQNCFCYLPRQNSTKSDNFWHKDGKQSKIIWGAVIFHLT